jgi:hypothetical protein
MKSKDPLRDAGCPRVWIPRPGIIHRPVILNAALFSVPDPRQVFIARVQRANLP